MFTSSLVRGIYFHMKLIFVCCALPCGVACGTRWSLEGLYTFLLLCTKA